MDRNAQIIEMVAQGAINQLDALGGPNAAKLDPLNKEDIEIAL